jgi:hypothetical protein
LTYDLTACAITSYAVTDSLAPGMTQTTGCISADLTDCRIISLLIDKVTSSYSVRFTIASVGTIPTTSVAQMVTQTITFDVIC